MKRSLIIIVAPLQRRPSLPTRRRHVRVESVGRRRGNGLDRQFVAGPHPRRLQGPHALPVREGHAGRSACSGTCATYWPPLLTRGKPTARARREASLLGTIRRADGTTQVTYAGHPLYRYLPDTKPGQTNGQDSHDFGAGWYVLSPAGKKIEADERRQERARVGRPNPPRYYAR